MYLGEVRTALDRLERARQVASGSSFGDVDRAEVLYRLGCCRYKLTHVEQALEHFSAALELADRSGESCDRLRAHILEWRSRCYRRHRDWEAAREDIERALELAERQARHALELLDGRVDFLDEIGSARLVLGRALLEQGRLDEAEQTFAEAEQGLLQLSSASHSAAAWTARGELALARGDDKE